MNIDLAKPSAKRDLLRLIELLSADQQYWVLDPQRIDPSDKFLRGRAKIDIKNFKTKGRRERSSSEEHARSPSNGNLELKFIMDP